MPSVSVRVLGCSGAIAAGCHTTAFLLDASVLIDAGTGVGDLSLDELTRIDAVLLSHSHLDHVLGIPLLADAVMRRRRAAGRGPMQVYGLPETLAKPLRQHLFNGVIWPDFTRLPSPEEPALQAAPHCRGRAPAPGRACRRGAAGAPHRSGLRLRGTAPRRGALVDLQRRHRAQPAALAAPARAVRSVTWSSRPPSATTRPNWPAWRSTTARARCAPS
jgi:hypothetical protein